MYLEERIAKTTIILENHQLAVNQHPYNQTNVARKHMVPGVKSSRKTLTDDSRKDSCNIKIFCDSFQKGIWIK